MKRFILYGLGACMALMATGCTNSLTPELDNKNAGILQLLSVDLREPQITKAVVSNSTIDKTTVLVTKETSGDVYGTDLSASTLIFTKGGSGWTADKTLEITASGGDALAYGFYPSDASVTNESGNPKIGIKVLSRDKFSEGKQIDYLYGQKAGITPTGSAISLELAHALTKVSFQIDKSDNTTEKMVLTQVEIVSGTSCLQTGDGSMGLKDGALDLVASSSIKFTYSGDELSSSSGNTGIELGSGITSPNLSCLVAPMTKQESVLSFNLSVQVGDETEARIFSTKSANPVQWKAGEHYVYSITVKKMGGELTGVKMESWKNDASQNLNIDISE